MSNFRFVLIFVSGIVAAVLLIYRERFFYPNPLGSGADSQDYAAYFGAAQATASGALRNLYDPAVFQEYIGAHTTLFWLFPPNALLLFALLAGLSYPALKLVLASVTIFCSASAFWIARRSWMHVILGVFSPVTMVALWIGQISALFSLLLVAGLMFSRSHPVLAGLLLGLLTIKPTYGLMVIPFLVVIRAWQTMAIATVAAALLIAGSMLAYGVEPWMWFFESARSGIHTEFQQAADIHGRTTLGDAVIALGVSGVPNLALYGPVFALLCFGLFRLGRECNQAMLVAFTLAATTVIAPYFWIYDFFIINVAILIAQAGRQPTSPASFVFLGVWLTPLIAFSSDAVSAEFFWSICALSAAIIYHLARDRQRPSHAEQGNIGAAR